MWSNLVDKQERVRATIFYKAAFYDRNAFLNVSQRYRVSSFKSSDENGNIVKNSNPTHFATYILDGDKPMKFIAVRKKEYGSNQNSKG